MDVDSGEIVQISEWTINVRGENEIPVIQRQLSSIEQEFNHLMKLRHSNIAQYQNIKHELAKTKDKFVLYAVHEFIMGKWCVWFVECTNVNYLFKVQIAILYS